MARGAAGVSSRRSALVVSCTRGAAMCTQRLVKTIVQSIRDQPRRLREPEIRCSEFRSLVAVRMALFRCWLLRGSSATAMGQISGSLGSSDAFLHPPPCYLLAKLGRNFVADRALRRVVRSVAGGSRLCLAGGNLTLLSALAGGRSRTTHPRASSQVPHVVPIVQPCKSIAVCSEASSCERHDDVGAKVACLAWLCFPLVQRA